MSRNVSFWRLPESQLKEEPAIQLTKEGQVRTIQNPIQIRVQNRHPREPEENI